MTEIDKTYCTKRIFEFLEEIATFPFDEQVEIQNSIKTKMHELSPFKNEPVDCVIWVKNDKVVANDYNPNKVAPPEMELLEVSIMNDGYTQPIVTWPKGDKIEVIDGFHRSRVGKESLIVKERVKGYLPTVIIRKEQESKNDRIASTIRHNRARGKHQINAMSEIVIELKNRNWSNARIAKQLGMDDDEILRLCQISGLQELFKDSDFSKSWESSDSVEYEILTDDFDEIQDVRTVNTSDPDRIFHTWDKWECYKAGFYNKTIPGMTTEECELAYSRLLSSEDKFSQALNGVITQWKNSCEHYLTNTAMNRIAWLGQAAMCFALGIPSEFRSGFNILNTEQQDNANHLALKYLNIWMGSNNRKEIQMDEALSIGRQVNIY
jgi:ParB-like chromosome segregation protein Spo0J